MTRKTNNRSVSEKHNFALFYPETTEKKRGKLCTIGAVGSTSSDKELVHRIFHVLRLTADEELVLFDEKTALHVTIVESSKKQVICQIDASHDIVPLDPAIDWLLPLLEKAAFEQTFNALTVLGARKITPILTHKSRAQAACSEERIRRLMIAAAEQSKQLALPQLKAPVDLEKALRQTKTTHKILFHQTGMPTFDLLSKMRKTPGDITCLIGPEGDLTGEELTACEEAGFVQCNLGPSVLESWHAASLAMGIMRACIEPDL